MGTMSDAKPTAPASFAASDKLAKSLFILTMVGAVAFVAAVFVFVL
jgi:hypothetical protein